MGVNQPILPASIFVGYQQLFKQRPIYLGLTVPKKPRATTASFYLGWANIIKFGQCSYDLMRLEFLAAKSSGKKSSRIGTGDDFDDKRTLNT